MTAARRRSIVDTITALHQEARADAQIPTLCVHLGPPPPSSERFEKQLESSVDYLVRTGYAVWVSGGMRNAVRCKKAGAGQRCRHHGHFLFITPSGLKRFRKEMFAAFTAGERSRRRTWKRDWGHLEKLTGEPLKPHGPLTPRRVFYAAVRAKVDEIQALPLV